MAKRLAERKQNTHSRKRRVCTLENPEKQRFLKELREYARDKKVPTIIKEEVDWAREYVALFKCPLGFNPLTCSGHACPTKTKPNCRYGKCDLNPKTCGGPFASCFDDYREDCNEYCKALSIIDKVNNGKVRVVNQKIAVKLP